MQKFKTAFTMIELIFVIIILGILAAVAVPRMVSTREQADEGLVKGFVGTLNRTLGVAKWSKSMMDDDNGSIRGGGTANTYNITSTDTEFPSSFDTLTIATEKCLVDSATGSQNGGVVLSTSDSKYHIVCRDGNESSSPKFWYKEGNTTTSVEINGTLPKAKAP